MSAQQRTNIFDSHGIYMNICYSIPSVKDVHELIVVVVVVVVASGLARALDRFAVLSPIDHQLPRPTRRLL